MWLCCPDLLPKDAAVLTVEYKINLMKPAAGRRFRATGKVLKAGRTLSVCSGSVEAQDGAQWSLIALMQATRMAVPNRDGLKD
jgi:acyl-coenzyme A thioesterase PaaI-like protein